MVHIAEHHGETYEGFSMEEEAASSTPQSSGHPTLGAAAVRPTRRRTSGWVSWTPSGDTPAGMLSAARELLRHLPSPTASPGAMRQWRDDVDRLLGMAHTGSIRPRPRSSWRRHEASASERTPSVRTASTGDLRMELNRRRAEGDAQVPLEGPGDLRDELNRRRAGRDACISLEKTRERCGNLGQDSAAVAPRAPGDARFQTSIPLAGVGCAALAEHLRAAMWPSKFWPHLPEKYDGTTNLSEFLQVYVTAITAVGGDTAVLATYFHVALSGPSRTWLMNQAPGSIYSWDELCARFVANFACAYQRHGVEAHLHAVRQGSGETLRAFISRFSKVRGTILRISDASIITAFRQGYMMRRCWRSWPRMMWTTSPHSLPWLTSAPEPPRAVLGTRYHRPRLPRWTT
jgi:hypothetical protein